MPNDNTTIFKVRRKKGQYAALPNALLRETGLTFQARGLLAYLLSLPEDWEVRFSSLLKQSPARRTALRRMIKECIAAGYMKRERVKAGGGRFQWVTEVYEEPLGASMSALSEDAPSAGFRPMEDLSAEDPSADIRSAGKLSIKERLSYESPADERLTETTTEATAPAGDPAADVESSPAPPSSPPSKERVFIPNPFPLDEELLTWAAEICPLVDVEDVASKLVSEYHPESVGEEKATKKSMRLWRDKFVQWIRREQKFEVRDRAAGKFKDKALDGDRPVPYAGGAATVNFAAEAAAKGQYASCPDCYGTGQKMEPGKGVTGRCKHERWVPDGRVVEYGEPAVR
jgi:hypothetical protein